MLYRRPIVFISLLLCTALVICAGMSSAQEEAQAINPEAEKVLLAMGSYLGALEQFTFHAENTREEVTSAGQKLQYALGVDVKVKRPDRVAALVEGDKDNKQLFYDGKTVTLFRPAENFYGTLDAPPTIDEALDFALKAFALKAPLSELLYSDPYAVLSNDVESGAYLGLHRVQGVKCHHLAFRKSDLDWQLWVEHKGHPLPRKVVITAKRVAGAPQFTALLNNWNLTPSLQDSDFTFSPPEGAEKIEFIPASHVSDR